MPLKCINQSIDQIDFYIKIPTTEQRQDLYWQIFSHLIAFIFVSVPWSYDPASRENVDGCW